MFEAHIYKESTRHKSSDSKGLVQFNAPAKCWHNLYQCHVRYWLAPGKRQSQTKQFLYIEYINRNNTHDYRVVELAMNSLTTEKAQDIITQTLLSEHLDPLRTEKWSNFSE